MGRRRPSEIESAIGSVIFVLVMLLVAWILFSKQITAAFENFITKLINALIGLAAILIVGGGGFYIAWKLEERGYITAGWGVIVAIVIFFILNWLPLGNIGGWVVLADLSGGAAFVWLYLDQNQIIG
ncbi:MAG: hypothetical protein QXR73_03095 [Candidatus Micrarchaeaceae archaeon]